MQRVRNILTGKHGVVQAVSPRGKYAYVFYDGQEYGTGGICEEVENLVEA